MDKNDLIRIAKATAKAHNLPPDVFCGLVEHESSWDTWAMRYEPAFFVKYISPMTGMLATEKYARATSFGLCQVMGEVAREMGFTQRFLTELCDPVVGLEYGARKLKSLFDATGGNPRAALLKYNGGGDDSYPDAVFKAAKNYQ